ncbi:hypothetical protein Btru_062208 [Bulinus truncatus]|nr:hypothetical protein Btru_062208 [Bulinus truncatus]
MRRKSFGKFIIFSILLRNKFVKDAPFEYFEAQSANEERTCKKNPKHLDFIPVKHFKIEDLPEKYQDLNIFESIRLLADLTVLVKVSMKGIAWLGSGRVSYVMENTGAKKCPCSHCKASGLCSDKWWEIVILTSSDMIHDKRQTINVTCRLFYDDFNVPVVIMNGYGIILPHVSEGIRQLLCVTCDQNIVSRLKKTLDNYATLFKRCFDTYWETDKDDKL